jgi:hypothetical protein
MQTLRTDPECQFSYIRAGALLRPVAPFWHCCLTSRVAGVRPPLRPATRIYPTQTFHFQRTLLCYGCFWPYSVAAQPDRGNSCSMAYTTTRPTRKPRTQRPLGNPAEHFARPPAMDTLGPQTEKATGMPIRHPLLSPLRNRIMLGISAKSTVRDGKVVFGGFAQQRSRASMSGLDTTRRWVRIKIGKLNSSCSSDANRETCRVDGRPSLFT